MFYMKKHILFILGMLFCIASVAQNVLKINDGGEYYILNTYYDRPLTRSSDGTQPRLKQYVATNDEEYIWVAEKTETSGVFLLRHKKSGKYLMAATSNTYGTKLDSKGTGNEFKWVASALVNGKLVSLRNRNTALGVDKGSEGSEYIGVYYDKVAGAKTSVFQIVPHGAEGLQESLHRWLREHLRGLVTFILGETESKEFDVIKTALRAHAQDAESWLSHAEDFSCQRLQERHSHLTDSLLLMTSQNEAGIMNASEMSSFGGAFSLAISNFALTHSARNDSVAVVLRDKNGMGIIYYLKEADDYILIRHDDQVDVYRSGQLAEEVEVYCLPPYTSQGTAVEWSLLRSDNIKSYIPEIVMANGISTDLSGIKDSHGNMVRTLPRIYKGTMHLDKPIDLHITSQTEPITGSTIYLENNKAWVIFDEVRPSEVISTYLRNFKIGNSTPILNTNCRVVIYKEGALVMPWKPADKVFTGYSGEMYSGEEVSLPVGAHKDLGENNNKIRSFHLMRGYMAVVASDVNGKGYSRVYVADHEDMDVDALPAALNGRISSITIKKWQYVSKKGWCSTNSNDAIASQTAKMKATWFYTWSADRSSTYDTEYIPIRQHLYWPSVSQIAGHTDATACLSFNEPEHEEQHTSDKCGCGGTISEWTSCEKTRDLYETGMRIGSPAPTDPTWLTTFAGHCDDMNYRCDFVAIHCYWGSNEANDGNAWYSRLKEIYEKTKRPIWITEWAYGASWTSESWPSGWDEKLEQNRWRILDIQNKLEEAPFVERYAYYQWDTQFRNFVDWNDGHITPAGAVYRDKKSGFAFNQSVQHVTTWWTPTLKNISLTAEVDGENLKVSIKNPNLDLTEILTIQHYDIATGEWSDYYTEKNRALFDGETLTYTFPLQDFDTTGDRLRAYVKRHQNDETYSGEFSFGYITNPGIYTTDKGKVEGWTCTRDAANGYTEGTGDTYFEVWSEKAAGMEFNYYQDVKNLPDGIYELSAKVFNSTNTIASAWINGNVGLYAQTDSAMWFVPVTEDCIIDNCPRLTIRGIVVQNGTLRVGIRNIGEMSARWAGGDDFSLTYISPLHDGEMTAADGYKASYESLVSHMQGEGEEERDASCFIVNPDNNRKDSYGWTVTNIDYASGNAWDGNSSNTYWNNWKSSAYTSTMTQSITGLPDGLYTASVIARANAASTCTLTLRNEVTGAEQTGELTPSGDVSPAGSPYVKGWQDVVTPEPVLVRQGEKVTITLKCVEAPGGWWSADHFGLKWQYIEPLPTKVDTIEREEQRGSDSAYDLTGRKVMSPKGIYIKNNKKYIQR